MRRVSSERVSNAPKRWRRVHAVVESAHAPCVSFTGRAAAAATSTLCDVRAPGSVDGGVALVRQRRRQGRPRRSGAAGDLPHRRRVVTVIGYVLAHLPAATRMLELTHGALDGGGVDEAGAAAADALRRRTRDGVVGTARDCSVPVARAGRAHGRGYALDISRAAHRPRAQMARRARRGRADQVLLVGLSAGASSRGSLRTGSRPRPRTNGTPHEPGSCCCRA